MERETITRKAVDRTIFAEAAGRKVQSFVSSAAKPLDDAERLGRMARLCTLQKKLVLAQEENATRGDTRDVTPRRITEARRKEGEKGGTGKATLSRGDGLREGAQETATAAFRRLTYAAKTIADKSVMNDGDDRDEDETEEAVSDATELARSRTKDKYLERTTGSGYKGKTSTDAQGTEKTGGKTAKKPEQPHNRRAEHEYYTKHRNVTQVKQKEANKAAEKAKNTTTSIAHRLQEWAENNKRLILIAALVLVIVLFGAFALSSCAAALGNGGGIAIGGAAPTTDADMSECDTYFSGRELALQREVNNVYYNYPGKDEYNISLDPIGHDAVLLASYLAAVYEGYDLRTVQGELDRIFNEMYTITAEEITETRYYREERTGYYPEDVYDEEGVFLYTEYVAYTYYEWVPYDYFILNYTLDRKDLEGILLSGISTEEQRDNFDLYKTTGCGHQTFSNPFDVDWGGYVSSEFGWRVNPITWSDEMHNGIDLALPSGTEVKSTSKGKVKESDYDSSMGNYVVVEDEAGYEAYYMHLSARNVSAGEQVEAGTVIGKVGSTGSATGPHLHLGIKGDSGGWINPRFVLSR